MEPLIAPPGVAYVEQTSTWPTLSVMRVGGVPGGTDTQPVNSVWEKCSTMPTTGGAATGARPRSRPAALPNLPTNDTLLHLPAGPGGVVDRRADTLLLGRRPLGWGNDESPPRVLGGVPWV
ncbi:hypothetical protein GCM10023349_17920 [Nocardioides conyzicola]|uniref:Uncharacterized protein n=1 Tax=Nocardioides conyzicola TaxID=1651781 RepID=A0ABP8X653_9ACTN